MSAPPGERPRERQAGLRGNLALLAVCALVSVVWAGVVSLPFTGEDFVILGRVARGEVSSPHVFRPTSELWFRVLHGLFGAESAAPYHAGSLLLHLVCVVLVYRITRRLLDCRATALLTALVFGVGAGATDSLAWVAAVNRPLSGVGALLAILGALTITEHRRRGWTLVVAGFVLQLLSNEEAFGTGVLLVVLCALASRRDAIAAGLVVATLLVAYTLVFRSQGDVAVPAFDAAAVWESFVARNRVVAQGLGFPVLPGLFLSALAAVFLLRCRRAALVVLAVWLCAFLPFVLSEPSRYRFYPSLFPTALLCAGGFVALIPRPQLRPAACFFCGILVLYGSQGERSTRVAAWREAVQEVATCAQAAAEMARERDTPPVLVNLEISSTGPFFYHFGFEDPARLTRRHFLDAASGYADPGPSQDLPAGAWWGRRLEGSYGWIEPERYFARPLLPDLFVVEEAVLVGSLVEARSRLADPALDLAHTVVLEAAELSVALDPDRGGPAPILDVVAPFAAGDRHGHLRVRAALERPAVVVYQANWMFDAYWRVSPDQAVLTDAVRRRRIDLTVTDTATGKELDVVRANAFGLAALVPAGEHELAFDFSLGTFRD